MWGSFDMSADSDGEFLVFWDVVSCGNYSFGSGIRQVVSFYVCVSSDFV
jgi:hypothetical protein